MVADPLDDRLQQPDRLAYPIAQGRAIEIEPLASIDLALPIKRQMIGIFRHQCQSARNWDPGSAWKRDPSPALGQACPGSEQEGPARVAQCPHERRSGARGRCLFAHRGKPGWHSGAVFEPPALVAGFDDFAMMGQAVEERGRHLGVAKHAGPITKGQIGGDDDGSVSAGAKIPH